MPSFPIFPRAFVQSYAPSDFLNDHFSHFLAFGCDDGHAGVLFDALNDGFHRLGGRQVDEH